MSNVPNPVPAAKPQDPCRALTPIFRAAFAHVMVPKKQNPDSRTGAARPDKFQLTMLYPANTDLTVLRNAANEALKRKFGDYKSVPKGITSPFKSGDEKDYDGFAGMIYLEASTSSKPNVVDKFCQTITSSDEFYSGCYARATVTASYYEVMSEDGRSVMKRGIKFYLNNVQKMADGQPFVSQRSAQDDFANAPGTEAPPAGTPAADFRQPGMSPALGASYGQGQAMQRPAGAPQGLTDPAAAFRGQPVGVPAGAGDEPPF